MTAWDHEINVGDAARLVMLAKRFRATHPGIRSEDVYADYGICQILDMPFAWDGDFRGGFFDASLRGRPIQIKVTTYATRPHLIFDRLEDFTADLCVLVLVHQKVVTLMGWVSRADFYQESKLKNLGSEHGLQSAMRLDQLRPMDDFPAAVELPPIQGPHLPPMSLYDRVVAAYWPCDDGTRCHGCRIYTENQEPLAEFARLMHYGNCTVMQGAPIPETLLAVDKALAEQVDTQT